MIALTLAGWLLGLLPVASPAGADDSRLSSAATVRLRFEREHDFSFGAQPGDDEDYLLTQVRFNLDWQPAARVRFFVEIQDSRIFGQSAAIDDEAVPNVFADDHAWYHAGAGVVRQAAPGIDVGAFVGSELDFTLTIPFEFAAAASRCTPATVISSPATSWSRPDRRTTRTSCSSRARSRSEMHPA